MNGVTRDSVVSGRSIHEDSFKKAESVLSAAFARPGDLPENMAHIVRTFSMARPPHEGGGDDFDDAIYNHDPNSEQYA